MLRRPKTAYPLVLGVALILVISACTPSSDAGRILESDNTSLRATVNYYEKLAPTMTAQAVNSSQKIATLQSDLNAARAQVKDLTNRLNTGAVQPTLASNLVSAGTLPPGDPGGLAGTPGTPSAGLVFERVVTARGKDYEGCPVNEATTFSTDASMVYVIAKVRNFKRGMIFTARWTAEGFKRDTDQWTANQSGAQMCIHFFIEPRTLGLKAGTYTVIMAAGDVESKPVQFTLQ